MIRFTDQLTAARTEYAAARYDGDLARDVGVGAAPQRRRPWLAVAAGLLIVAALLVQPGRHTPTSPDRSAIAVRLAPDLPALSLRHVPALSVGDLPAPSTDYLPPIRFGVDLPQLTPSLKETRS